MARIKNISSSQSKRSLSAGINAAVSAHVAKDPTARREISQLVNDQVKSKVQPTAEKYLKGLVAGLANTYSKGFPDQLASHPRNIEMALPEIHGDGTIGTKLHAIKVHVRGLKPNSRSGKEPYYRRKRRTYLSGGRIDGRPVLGGGHRLRLLTGMSAEGIASLKGQESVTFSGRATQGKISKRGSRSYLSIDRQLIFNIQNAAQWNDLLIQSLLSGSPATVDVSHLELSRRNALTRALHQEIDRPIAGPAAAITGRIMMKQLKRLRFETNLTRRV